MVRSFFSYSRPGVKGAKTSGHAYRVEPEHDTSQPRMPAAPVRNRFSETSCAPWPCVVGSLQIRAGPDNKKDTLGKKRIAANYERIIS